MFSAFDWVDSSDQKAKENSQKKSLQSPIQVDAEAENGDYPYADSYPPGQQCANNNEYEGQHSHRLLDSPACSEACGSENQVSKDERGDFDLA
jgi:hypothetical protein